MTDQLLANVFTTSIQDEPSVAMDANGDFVISWTSYGQDSDRDGVFARRFNVQGQALGGEFQVNTYVKDRQDQSDVAMDANGDFTVVWESYGEDGSSWGIFGQRFDHNGAKVGGEFPVNTYTNAQQVDPKIAMDPTGDFAVVWSSNGQDGSGYGIYARRYNAAGAATDPADVQVNQTTLNWQVTPDVGMDANGNLIVVWSSFQDTNPNTTDLDYGIYGREIYANNQSSSEFSVNVIKPGDQITPAITNITPGGGYVVVWVGPDSGSTGIYSRLYPTANGTLSTTTPTSQVAALPARTSTSSFGVSWSGASVPGGASLARLQRVCFRRWRRLFGVAEQHDPNAGHVPGPDGPHLRLLQSRYRQRRQYANSARHPRCPKLFWRE